MNCANHPDRERQAFCQNCGKPVCRECARVVGQAVFCEPCLEARLAATAPPFAAAAYGTVPVQGTQSQGSASAQGSAPDTAGYQAVPGGPAAPFNAAGDPAPRAGGPGARSGMPNPLLAGLLGFIPGVGAMFNEQYAKGIVHLVVFAILVSLSDHSGLFSFFVAGWVFYQPIEAYHTARARRDGTPLPNPFGLNDIGERLGFGRAWGSAQAPPVAAAAPPPPVNQPTYTSAAQAAPESTRPYAEADPFVATDSRTVVTPLPLDTTRETGWSSSPPPPPYVAPEPSPYPPLSEVPVPPPTQTAPPLPIGAIVLIGLGILFLLGDTPWVGSLPFYLILPVLLIGTGVWIFVRRMTARGASFSDDGSAAYRLRLLSAVRSSVWVVLVGILFLLDSLHILSWGRSWPLFIIVAGVLALLHRSTAVDVRRRSVDTPYGASGPSESFPSASRESER